MRVQVETDAKYAVYLQRQEQSIADYERNLSYELPEHLDYLTVPGLSNEIRARLEAAKPRSLAHAHNIEGMTPAGMTLLAAHVRKTGHQ